MSLSSGAPLRARNHERSAANHVVVRPISPENDAAPLYAEGHSRAADADNWTYLPEGPYAGEDDMREALLSMACSDDPLYFALVPLSTERPAGVAAFQRIKPEHVICASASSARAEAVIAAYELGLVKPGTRPRSESRTARQRNHMVVKGRNRDSAWFAMTDKDWPVIRDRLLGLIRHQFGPSR